MATEYDLLRLLLSRQEKHNQRTATSIDKRINITATPIDKRINITKLLLSLLRTRPSWLGAHRRACRYIIAGINDSRRFSCYLRRRQIATGLKNTTKHIHYEHR
jgi:hypothetical protein